MAAQESFDVVVTKKTENGPVNQPENQPVNAQEFVALRDQGELMDLIDEWNSDLQQNPEKRRDDVLVPLFKVLDSRLADETAVNKFVANDALLDQKSKKKGDKYVTENDDPIKIEGGGKRKNAAQQLQQFFKNQLLKRKNKNKNGGRSRKQNKRNQKNKSSKRQRGGQQSRRQQQQRNKNKKSRRQQKKN